MKLEDKIYCIKRIWRETKILFQVSGRFELSRVQVTEGKMTVNVWRKSRGNWLWVKLAWSSSCRWGLKIKYQYVKQTITCSDHYMNKILLINIGSKNKIYKSRQILWWICSYHKRFETPSLLLIFRYLCQGFLGCTTLQTSILWINIKLSVTDILHMTWW